MDNDTPSKPAFLKIQDTILNLTNCVSFKFKDDEPNTVLVETRLKVHIFPYTFAEDAKSTMRQIVRTIEDAGYKVPAVREP
jgi:hypothetical protein